MRKLGYFAAAIILAGSVSVAVAQERAPQHSGFGTGVGDSQGSGTRARVMDEGDMLRYLSQPETIQGRVLGVDLSSGRMFLDMGGSSHDERQMQKGSLNIRTLFFDGKTNLENLKAINKNDNVSVQVVQETNPSHKFSTGRVLVRSVYVLRGTQVLGGENNPGFGGGLGQRPDPTHATVLSISSGGYTGVPEGGMQEGVVSGGITSSLGSMTGAAPCWQCAPQPEQVNKRSNKTIATDYGSNRANFNKGTVQ